MTGTLRARRFRATQGPLTYVALYHLVSSEVVTGAEWKKAVETPWTERLRPHMHDRLRLVCKPYQRHNA